MYRLNEICKVSTIKATTALSKFIRTPLGIRINPIEIEQEISIDQYYPPEHSLSLVSLITGNILGAAFCVFSKKNALAWCDVLYNHPEGTAKKITQLEESALAEVANIVIGNFLSAFGQSLQTHTLLHRTAKLIYGPFDEQIFSIMDQIRDHKSEKIVKISFTFKNSTTEGTVIIMLNEKQVRSILTTPVSA